MALVGMGDDAVWALAAFFQRRNDFVHGVPLISVTSQPKASSLAGNGARLLVSFRVAPCWKRVVVDDQGQVVESELRG